MKRIFAKFYQTGNGREPVRDWLLEMEQLDRSAIGYDIKTAEYGWPIGMPVVRKMATNLWEVRTNVANGIARVFFTVVDDQMILLHGIVKQTQKTPKQDLDKARNRMKEVQGE